MGNTLSNDNSSLSDDDNNKFPVLFLEKHFKKKPCKDGTHNMLPKTDVFS